MTLSGEFPGFDWRNTPAYKHPGGKDCPCPKHEYIREQINFAKQMNNERGSNRESSRVTLRFCPDHYRVYVDEVIPSMPLKYRILTKIALRMGAIKVVQLKYMEVGAVLLLQVRIRRLRQKERAAAAVDGAGRHCGLICILGLLGVSVVALLAAQGAALAIQKDALAYVRLKVRLRRLCVLAGAVAEGALGVEKLYDASPSAYGAPLCHG